MHHRAPFKQPDSEFGDGVFVHITELPRKYNCLHFYLLRVRGSTLTASRKLLNSLTLSSCRYDLPPAGRTRALLHGNETTIHASVRWENSNNKNIQKTFIFL